MSLDNIPKSLSDFFIQKKVLEILHPDIPPIQFLQYDVDHFSDQFYSFYEIQKPPSWSSWIIKRKAQFLAGRLACCSSLQALDINETLVLSGENREPIWPENSLGSISHTKNFSIATTINSAMIPALGIGVDIEEMIDENELEKIKKIILITNDFTLFDKKSNLTDQQLLTLIFSCKESFFKAAYPNAGRYFDFNTVSIKLIDFKSQQVIVKSEITLSDQITAGNEYKVLFEFLDIGIPVVITYCQL